MNTNKQIICPTRVRRIPDQFSWVDQRLVREHYMEQCTTQALALYLFYVTVGDAQGLSYYSDARIARTISLYEMEIDTARRILHEAGLIAYRRPLVQVLELREGYKGGHR